MTCEVRNKENNSQCAELLVRPLYSRKCVRKINQVSMSKKGHWLLPSSVVRPRAIMLV